MNLFQIASRYAAAGGIAVLTLAILIGLIRAEEPAKGPTPPQAAGQTLNPEAMSEEVERIKEFIHQIPSIRELNPSESDTTVTHLTGHHYVAKVVYAKGNAWRLYLVQPLPGNPRAFTVGEIGIAAGEFGLDRCMDVLLDEQGWPDAKIDYVRLVQQILQALSADYGVVVKQNADIPGYDKAPLAADLAAVIRPMWTYVSKGPRGEQITHYVTYTYQQIAGQVFRHEFAFGGRIHSARTVRVATGVGDIHLLK